MAFLEERLARGLADGARLLSLDVVMRGAEEALTRGGGAPVDRP